MEVPEITHLQFLVLAILQDGELLGREVREQLSSGHNVRKSAPAFYQLMARLEDSGAVSGQYDQMVINGQIIKQRKYKLTAEGAGAVESVRRFYASVSTAKQRGDRIGLARARVTRIFADRQSMIPSI